MKRVYSQTVSVSGAALAGSERTIAWLTGYRRLTLRYERKATHFCAFLTLGATLTGFKKLTRSTT